MDYMNMDADDLRYAMEQAQGAKRGLESAIEKLRELEAVTALESAEDALSELEDEIRDLDRALTAAEDRETAEALDGMLGWMYGAVGV